MQTANPWLNLSQGLDVRSVSGAPLGTVGAVRRTCFRLDGNLRPMWLVRDAVFTVDDGVVSLICEEQGLEHLRDDYDVPRDM